MDPLDSLNVNHMSYKYRYFIIWHVQRIIVCDWCWLYPLSSLSFTNSLHHSMRPNSLHPSLCVICFLLTQLIPCFRIPSSSPLAHSLPLSFLKIYMSLSRHWVLNFRKQYLPLKKLDLPEQTPIAQSSNRLLKTVSTIVSRFSWTLRTLQHTKHIHSGSTNVNTCHLMQYKQILSNLCAIFEHWRSRM